LMAFAAARLLRDNAVTEKFGVPPTVIVIADRKDLVRQTAQMFETAGMPRLTVPRNRRELHDLLRRGEPGVVITTVHKFAEAGHLNDRSNIIVLVDEAHRSQEGQFGEAWRAAVPNAKFFGATGTAVQDKDRSTFKLFGDPSDPDFVMSRYTPEQSIADGFTKPVIVEGRSVGFSLDKEALDEAFDELAASESLDEDEKVYLAGKASHIETILSNPDRVAAVCADIVDHFLTYVAPLGQKAQVVAYNQSLVVAYARAIEEQLERRRVSMPDGRLREVGIVMHVADSKDTPQEHRQYLLTSEQEEALKRRFKKFDDPMSFVVVTAKWMTGFNAPIEGVLYLDKPAKKANLFQTITRPNRPWKNPITGQRKDYGRVVDYIGLAKAIGVAITDPNTDSSAEDDLNVVDASKLAGKFVSDLTTLLDLFAGIDTLDTSFESFASAHERIPEGRAQRTEFVEGYVALQTVWEFLDPHPMLLPFRQHYFWLAKVYESIRPRDVSKAFLWARLGAKTSDLIHGHMTELVVKTMAFRTITLDAAGLAMVKRIAEQLRLPASDSPREPQDDVYQQVLNSIEARLRRRLAENGSPAYTSLAERIEKLRAKAIENVEDSLAFLEEALKIAQDVVAADRAAEAEDEKALERLVDPKRGVLTQIVEENTPTGLHQIVPEIVDRIDAIVDEVAYTGWTTSDSGDKSVRRELRAVLKNYALPIRGDLFDRIYQYVRENY
jgi:type I restriction enzyme R subunit